MRFTKVQTSLFRCDISFVHMAPDETRRSKAMGDFLTELNTHSVYYAFSGHTVVYKDHDNKVFARFSICTLAGEAQEHCPVIFMDGKKDEFKHPKAYDEARYIPAEIDGCGPMVVR